jgi:hypothetical protein
MADRQLPRPKIESVMELHASVSRDLSILRQIYQRECERTAAQFAQYRSKLVNIRSVLNHAENQPRQPQEQRRLLEESARQLEHQLCDIESKSTQLAAETRHLKEDIIKRKRYPARNQLVDCTALLGDINDRLVTIQRFRSETMKPLCKQVWEHELQRVVGEQSNMKQLDGRLNQLGMECDSTKKQLAAIDPISRLNPIDSDVSVSPPSLVKATKSSHGHEGMTSVLDELSVTVTASCSTNGDDINSSTRLSAIDRMECEMQKNRRERQSRDQHPLLRDIQAFHQDLLRPTGGIQATERKLQSRTRHSLMLR